MKPYRLINAVELHQLNQQFKQELDAWNEEYSCIPLGLHLAMTPKNYRIEQACVLQEHDDELGFIEGDYLSVITLAVFGRDQSSFHATSKELFLKLLHKFFQCEESILQPYQGENPNWFYAGSTSVLLTLTCEHNNFRLIVNPDWIYQQLPAYQSKGTPLSSLDEALTEQKIYLALELRSSNLSIKGLAQLQIGDVLSTKHPLTEPLRVTSGKELFAEAELGQSASHKSIVLKRKS
ncbi:FliM/FliN family flagellar motor C-terminal domain-containing protein [Legionella saoudiensis]|uniref:FliM/FliN family flagellar motor C-terminal domain-containing protein n=1 Tax=Legionella saoudiensis TaxID=1750561 RepID=UPI000731109A|nr:FliM/FliN family flagellar motor C-terminal domain-containing protein [Legionella saoudiensis]